MAQLSEATTLDPVAKKSVLRLFTYGLYAIGVADGEDRNMFTANWLTQVSFEPPLVAISVENDGHSIDLLERSSVFAISVFADDQRREAGLLGKRWRLHPDKLDAIPHHLSPRGCPGLDGALGLLECSVLDSVPAGDSTLFVAEMLHAELLAEGKPLTMAEAGFRHSG